LVKRLERIPVSYCCPGGCTGFQFTATPMKVKKENESATSSILTAKGESRDSYDTLLKGCPPNSVRKRGPFAETGQTSEDISKDKLVLGLGDRPSCYGFRAVGAPETEGNFKVYTRLSITKCSSLLSHSREGGVGPKDWKKNRQYIVCTQDPRFEVSLHLDTTLRGQQNYWGRGRGGKLNQGKGGTCFEKEEVGGGPSRGH